MQDKKLEDINYKPLEQMTGAFGRVIREKFKVSGSVFLSLLIALSVVLVMVAGVQSVNILFLAVVLLVGYIGYHAQKIRNNAWIDFGVVNGWHITEVTPNDPHYIPPGLFGIGHSQVIGDVVQACFEGHSCDIYSYQFTVGSGKNQKSYYYTIARVLLDKPFPHLVLDSKQSWSLIRRDMTTDSVKLEGDFSKHFNLYFEKNGHIDALSVITPDVMQTLIDSNNKQDIEIVGQSLFFIINSDHRNQNQVPVLFHSIDKLADDIKHKAKTLNYVSEYTEQELAHQVAVQAKKTKQKVTVLVLITLIIINIPIFIYALIMISAALSR